MAYINVSKELVKETAEIALEEIKARRLYLFNKEVDKVMAKRFFKPKTREEAEARVKMFTDGMASWEITGWGDKSLAYSLLDACNLSNEDTIGLDSKEINFIERYKKENK